MESKQDIISKLKELKPFLYNNYAVTEIGLFGSFASDSQGAQSDIDLLIELERPIGWKFFSLELYLEGVFGRKVDLVTKKALRKQLKTQILEQVSYI